MRFATIVKLAGVGILLLIVALVQVVKSIDVNGYRDLLAQAARAATGREASIRGKLSLRVSLSPALIANDVVLANAAWGTRPEMVRIDRLEAEIGLLPLLAREVRVSRLSLVGLDVLLERDGAGNSNWTPASPRAELLPAGSPVMAFTSLKISEISLKGAAVNYRDARGGPGEAWRISQLTIDCDGWTAPVAVTLDGTWNGRHIDVSGMFGSPADLTTPGKPTEVKARAVLAGLVASVNGKLVIDRQWHPQFNARLQAEASDLAESAKMAGLALPPMGAARVAFTANGTADAFSLSDIDLALGRRDAVALTLRGSVKNALAARGVDLALAIDGDSLAGLNRLFNLSLPVGGPVRMAGHLTDDEAGGWRLADVRGQFGYGDLAGESILRRERERYRIESRLASTNIDLGDLSPGKVETPRPGSADGRLLPDDPLPFAWLSAADGQLTWQIDHLIAGGLQADQVGLAVSLADGRLTLTSTLQSVAGGHLTADLAVDSTTRPPLVGLTLAGERLSLAQLLRAGNPVLAAEGMPTDLRVSLKGNGHSLRALMARLNGDIVVTTGAGTVQPGQGDSLAGDLLTRLSNAPKENRTEMQCIVGRFSVAEGLARSEALLLDTSLVTIGGRGSINLANETLDLTLAPKLKDAGQLNGALPLDIGGTLAHPVLADDQGAIVKGVVTAVGAQGLGAALPGNGESNPCLAALGVVKKVAKKAGKAGD